MRHRAVLCFCLFIAVFVVAGCEQSAPVRRVDQAGPVATGGGRTVRVAGVVLKWITADKARNYARAEPMIREAARRGADLVVTTECFLDGYAIRDKRMGAAAFAALGEPLPDGPYARKLAGLADELDIYLIAGMVERDGPHTYNTAALFGPDGSLIGRYRKRDIGHEVIWNTPGSASPVFDTELGRIGIIICADRRNAGVVRGVARNGVDFIICPSGGMWGPEHNDYVLQIRSAENHVSIVFVHPIEFLATDAQGRIAARRLIGEDMSIEPGRIDSAADSRAIVLYGLKLPA
jgi:predicted amidohydrolase